VLANDMHLPAQIPVVWYEVHLSCPDLEVTGASFAGAPGVAIGHNEFLAWGLANGLADQQDLYLERENPLQSGQFAWRDGWEDAQLLEERINVRRSQAPHIERVIITRHGPLITGLLANGALLPPLAVRWVGNEGAGFLASMLQLNGAAGVGEAIDALRNWSAPSQSVVLADVRGTIAWHFVGRIPGRTQNPGLVPAPGWTGEHEWDGYIPFAELPHLVDPESGRIVAANNRPAGDDFAHFMGLEFDPGYRAQRIDEMLAERERYSVRDMEEIQLDVTSKYAAELVRWLTLLNSEDSWEKVAIQSLRKWNLRMDPESTPALVFHYVLIDLLWMVFGDKLGAARDGYLGTGASPLFPFSSHIDKAQERLLALLNSDEHSVWYIEAATNRRRTRDELLQEALTHAVHQIRELLGDSALKWQWGRSHQVMYAHPLGSARLLRRLFNRGPVPIGGDNCTPLQTRHTPQIPLGMVQVIPTYRQIIEVGAWDRMVTVTATGQSGHPISNNYDDQMVMWREGVYHAMPWQRAAVEKIVVNTLRLAPAL
jgi:penicillin amidase